VYGALIARMEKRDDGMKNTLILVKGDETLILAYSSETTWIPLFLGFKLINGDGTKFVIVDGEFHINDDTLIYWVEPVGKEE